MPHDRLTVLTALETQGIAPVFYHPDAEVCLNVIRACARGGAPVVEFTNRGDFACDLFGEIARELQKTDPEVILGSGSVRDISEAQALGCEIVKLFPGASVGGPDFVKAVLGPMPWTKIMPTGGVDPDEASIAKWFGSGIVAAGMGSKLITDAAIQAKDWAGIEAKVRQTVEAIAAFRTKA